MKYAVVVSSKTGNTKALGDEIVAVLKQEGKTCLYSGAPCPQALDADIIFVGFWTDKGACSADAAAFLQQCGGKKVFLFGTAGFGGDDAYFARILQGVKKYLPDSVEEIGTFMCQGRMPQSVRARYETMPGLPPEKRQEMLDNFDRALCHPNGEDLLALRCQVMGK